MGKSRKETSDHDMAQETFIPHPKKTSKNMQFLKNSNRSAVLCALALKKASNRTELASYLNLTRMAISNIVNELRDHAIILEISSSENEGEMDHNPNGRPPKQLMLADWSISVICINIRRYSVSCMLMDINGNTKPPMTRPLPAHADNAFLMETVIKLIEEARETFPKIPIIGIGVSSIGPLDIYQKHLLNPPDFRNIRDVDIGAPLEERFHLPVYLDNDMNCSALAELYFGAGTACRDLVFLGLSAGVGAGIIMNEKILHGFGGFAGEVGHISINPIGPPCPCGQKGCIELYTRGENILENTGAASFEELNALLDQENPPRFVLNSIKQYIDAMHTLMVAVANSYDPNIMILGDIDIAFIKRFIPDLEEYMNSHMLNHGYKHIKVIPSALAEAASLYGAGSIVLQRVFEGELSLPMPYGG